MFLQWFQVFLQVFQMHVSSTLKRILQMLHLNISKVNRVLHLYSHLLLSRLTNSPVFGKK
jgi:hypothetical protein